MDTTNITTNFVLSEPLVELLQPKIQFPRLEAVLVHLLTAVQRQEDEIRSLNIKVRDAQKGVVFAEETAEKHFAMMNTQLQNVQSAVDDFSTRVPALEDSVATLTVNQRISAGNMDRQEHRVAQAEASVARLRASLEESNSERDAMNQKHESLLERLQEPERLLSKFDGALTKFTRDQEDINTKMQAITTEIKDVHSQLNETRFAVGRNTQSISMLEGDLQQLHEAQKDGQRATTNEIEKLSMEIGQTDRQWITATNDLRTVLKHTQDRVEVIEKHLAEAPPARTPSFSRQSTSHSLRRADSPASDGADVIAASIDDLRQKLSDALSVIVMLERRGRVNEDAVGDLNKRLETTEQGLRKAIAEGLEGQKDSGASPLVRRSGVVNCLSCNKAAHADTATKIEAALHMNEQAPSYVLHKQPKVYKGRPMSAGDTTTTALGLPRLLMPQPPPVVASVPRNPSNSSKRSTS